LGVGLMDGGLAQAQEPTPGDSPLHPTFPLLDTDGVNVLVSGHSLSTMQTCGTCHDTGFIADHSFHTSVGLESYTAPGQQPNGQPWEMSPGLFGGWDSIAYRYLTPPGDERYDLGLADWIKFYGPRHVGGGPATNAPDGTPLADLAVTGEDPFTHSYNPATSQLSVWDWSESGVEEMNCFLCHMADPDTGARANALAAGNFGWANTATLGQTDIVIPNGETWTWNPDAFTAEGELSADHIFLQNPTPENCGTCHGTVHDSATPLTPSEISAEDWHTQRTGQIFTGQRVKDTGLNVENKDELNRAYDIHAERNVACTDCHFSVNNPIYYQEPLDSRPAHLEFDPRRLDYSDYLVQPDHNLARSETAQHLISPEYADSMRRCESCHAAADTHDWLPYTDLHMAALSCESCHIPQLYAPALEQVDWTVITLDGASVDTYRGIESATDSDIVIASNTDIAGGIADVTSLITGFEPVLLSRTRSDGESQLAPFNLITTYFWTYGDPVRPVRIEDLRRVYLSDEGAGNSYRPEILSLFDEDGDGELGQAELRLDSDSKVALVQSALQGLGLSNPQIQGEIQPYSINHDVTNGDFATADCQACHTEDSRLSRPFPVAAYLPGDVPPTFASVAGMTFPGELAGDDSNALHYVPTTEALGLYLPGHNRVDWVGWLGLLALLSTLAGVFVHGGLRVYHAGQQAKGAHSTGSLRRVYMYSYYERAWHWMQAIVILLLLATGIVIHRPDSLGFLDFGLVVPVHNVLAVILLVNALFAAFYHFASGQIRQYLPEPHGYFRQMMMQTDYYVRGIFKGDPHPFQKSPEHKLNPLQQATYFMILNLLLPLQVLTGIFMWGAQEWPNLTARLGGLPWLAPFHTLIAWLFTAFLVLHIYLTTTGHTPLAAIKAMTVGWENVEVIENGDD